MPFRVRRRSNWDGSRLTSLPRCSGGCMAFTAFPLDLLPFGRVFGAFPHRTILCAWKRVLNPLLQRDGPLSFSACSGPLPSGFGHAVVSRFAVSRGRSATGCAGVPPQAPPHFQRRAVLAHAPPSLDTFPAQVAKPASRSPLRAIRHSCRAGLGLPRIRVDQLVGRCALLRRPRWVSPRYP